MAIVMHPAHPSPRPAAPQAGRTFSRCVILLITAPLAAALCWGTVDALAWTQSSLMQIYSVTASTTA